MALKGDRFEDATDNSFFMTDTATRGIIVVHNTAGSGAALDNALALVSVPGTINGVVSGIVGSVNYSPPAGLLLNDVVNYDLTRQHINWHKDEVQSGGKVLLLRRGWVVTNSVSGTWTGLGQPLRFSPAGQLTEVTTGNVSTSIVGRSLSRIDSDGYAKVEINITG